MKFFNEQIRIPDYSWLYNRTEQRTFCVVQKVYSGIEKTFRVHAYGILEVNSKKINLVPYETMEKLIESQSLIII